VHAFAAQALVAQTFLKIFQAMKEENWVLPVLYTVAMDLRRFALNADRQLAKIHRGKFGENLEKAAEVLMNMFRTCVSDTRAPLERSKKWGMLSIVNQLFKIYFKINKLQLCKPMIRAIDSLTFKEQFKIAHLVTYKFFVGKKALFDSDYKLANEYLSFAFEHCHCRSKNNKRLILIYLLPVKMQLGRMPSKKLLVKYGLDQFIDVAKAVCVGNLLLLNQALEQHQTFFIRAGIYLILEKLKIITYRNLFKKTCLLLNTHQLPIDAFQVSLHYMGATDVDTDEVHCILAHLIHLGYLKGYISYQHQKLVVSKKDAFPNLSTFL